MRFGRSVILIALLMMAACRPRADAISDSATRSSAQEFSAVFQAMDSVRLTAPSNAIIGRVRWILPVGNVLVLGDATTNDLKVFDRSGGYLRSMGRAGSGPGEFRGPRTAAVLSDGSLAVGDDANARVTIYDATLARQGTFTFPGIISGISAAPDGRVAVLALRVSETGVESYDVVHLYDSSGTLVRSGCTGVPPTRPMEGNVVGFSGALVGPTVMWTTMVENVARSCDVATGSAEKFIVGTPIYVPPKFPERPYPTPQAGQGWMGSQMWVNKLVGLDSDRYIVRFAINGTEGMPTFQYVLADRAGRTLAMTGQTNLWIEFAKGGDLYATRRRDSGDVWLLRLKPPATAR